MLRITVPSKEFFDERTEEFINIPEQTLQLEHSLVSVSKWESKWKKPFLEKKDRTREETLDYIRCMTLTQNVDPLVYRCLSEQNFKEIADYISDPMTATWFSDNGPKKQSREVVTSELIYYWMITAGIPFECQKWPLGRLLTLIKICGIKSKPEKKMGKKDIYSSNRALNAARRKASGSKG